MAPNNNNRGDKCPAMKRTRNNEKKNLQFLTSEKLSKENLLGQRWFSYLGP